MYKEHLLLSENTFEYSHILYWLEPGDSTWENDSLPVHPTSSLHWVSYCTDLSRELPIWLSELARWLPLAEPWFDSPQGMWQICAMVVGVLPQKHQIQANVHRIDLNELLDILQCYLLLTVLTVTNTLLKKKFQLCSCNQENDNEVNVYLLVDESPYILQMDFSMLYIE